MQTESNTFTPLLCIGRTEETTDVTSFKFTHLDNTPFEFHAGQFITIEAEIAGEPQYRAYSISSCPTNSTSITITIKRIRGGLVSNYLIDHLQPGIALPAMTAAGDFTLQAVNSSNDILFICAGSGITPCISMARWILNSGQPTNIHFIYSARSPSEVIMADTLSMLAEEHNNFQLSRIIETNPQDADHHGRLDHALFEALAPDLTGITLFNCGPEPYMQQVRQLAKQRNFDMTQFHQENFNPVAATRQQQTKPTVFRMVAPQYDKNSTIHSEQSLLEALEQSGIPIIGACRSGVCGACKCKVTGEVQSSSTATLTNEQIEQGYVLSCSATAKSDLVVEI